MEPTWRSSALVSSEALGGCDGGELAAWLPVRKKATALALHRPAMVARKRRGEAELGCSGAAPRRWHGCSARHRQDGEQASTGGASATATAS
jgi:hypothetical protein